MAKIRIKNLGKIAALLIRGICNTITFEVEDHGGVFQKGRVNLIWAFWHNRMFIFPYLHQYWFPDLHGVILTSPSGDGQIIADVCSQFGFEPVRGSSSNPKKGLQALIQLAGLVKDGREIGITPDGPRGPKYQLEAGIVKLAQLSGGTIVPVRVEYSHAIRFPTWDEFMLPLPFSRVKVILQPFVTAPRKMTEEEVEAQRLKVQNSLGED